MNVQVLQTVLFAKQSKRFHANQKTELDDAIVKIMKNPKTGDLKKGDLSSVYVYKFSMIKQLALLAYQWHEEKKELVLLSVGSHENFYRDLKE